MNSVSAKVIAACFGLSAFVVAILAGLVSGNETAQVLLRAVVAMAACYPAGLVIGLVCERIIAAHALARRQQNPAAGAADDDEALKTVDAVNRSRERPRAAA